MTLTRTHLFGFVGLVALAFALYWAKAEAQAVREKVIALQEEVDNERRAVRTLEAELTWVERPDRLEAAAKRNLGLVPLTADRIATLDEIDQIAPLRTASPVPTVDSNVKANAPAAIAEQPAASGAHASKSIAAKPATVTTVVGR
ncbi:cell division protein FtsL [Aquidulcibacter paucihalophilus]|uniref:cell division protein FtsL n=1 Tax=Aquidulcibacter paucihalophilus TaxID=1978549 RepID=UPI000A18B82E|nr:hypothetical protein [Aquidulcibacter paucihalophilus]